MVNNKDQKSRRDSFAPLGFVVELAQVRENWPSVFIHHAFSSIPFCLLGICLVEWEVGGWLGWLTCIVWIHFRLNFVVF